MRRLFVGIAVISLSTVGGFLQEAKAADINDPEVKAKFAAGLDRCYIDEDELVPHKDGYAAGKKAAAFVNAWHYFGFDMEPDTGDETPEIMAMNKKIFLSTRAQFAGIATVNFMKMGYPERAGCLAAQLTPLEEEPWSSVHSGLTDHLSPELKQHFFSVPER